MTREFLAQRGNLFSCYRACVVAPLAALVCENVGNFLVCQRLIPRLHDSSPVLLALNRDRTLQALENNHCRPARAADCKFRASQRRILAGHAKTVGLVTRLTIGRKNLLASIARRKFSLLAAARSSCHCFLRRGRRTHRVESAGDEISRVPAEVRAAKENRQPVDRDEPD